MRKILLCLTVGLLIAAVSAAVGQEAKPTGTPAGQPEKPTLAPGGSTAMATHVLTTPAQLKWGPPPPVFEPNAQFTVVSGDPSKPGLYVVRLKMPTGYKIMPHWHPTDEHVTVISGAFGLGMGDRFEPAQLKELPAGGYALLPAQMHHYAMALNDAIVQVHGMGPFALTYVNPADDPSKHLAGGK
jgi:quercetin dioxygenase-like cupin family protein